MSCDTTDFMYPIVADIYYPIVSQSAYGDLNKKWVLDKSVACAFAPGSRKTTPQVNAAVELMQDNILLGRTRCDIRISSSSDKNAITNVLITNIRDKDGNFIYVETSGIRAGRPTLFEVASNQPIVGPFGNTDYFRVLIRRSENQGADL
jgi:hypothetical protein